MNMHNVDFTRTPHKPPWCQECGEDTRAQLGLSDTCYPDEPELHGRPMWICPACGAWANCEPGTLFPKSRPAGPETRVARHKAYTEFRAKLASRTGVSSKDKARNRTALYFFGSKAAKMSFTAFQFGWMTREQAEAVSAYLATVP